MVEKKVTPTVDRTILKKVSITFDPEIKLCIKCKYCTNVSLYSNNFELSFYCHHSKGISVVTGEMDKRCVDMRKDDRLCGESGALWEPFEKAKPAPL